MEKRTVEMILILKGHSKIKYANTLKQSFVKFLAYLFDNPEYYYPDSVLSYIVQDAVKDALSSCSDPGQIRAFMFNYFEARKWHDELEAFISALQQMQVKNGEQYINGFTKEVVEDTLKSFYKERYEVVEKTDVSSDSNKIFAIWDKREENYYTNIYSRFTPTFFSKEEGEKELEELISKLTVNR